MTTANDIQSIRNKVAKSDMRRARKETAMAITDTTKGVIELRYDHSTRFYTIALFHGGDILAQGTGAEIIGKLAALYTVAQ